ncbi:patellin-3-like [Vigna unguiculata]|uniref:CRAL-TRIO lipid binding n=1 Tax=Vigna unguiculata TaxID=3917 RepID=A0A4D6LL82_VIGUN|nr:patellin-3-like [Vigna unguiculata]QCD89046.1 CRAL-TRIO lipid binding [Vigna unguiculata]
MAQEPQNPPPPQEVPPLVDPVPVDNPPTTEPQPEPQPEPEVKPPTTEAQPETETLEKAQTAVEDKISESVSFKEETNVVGDLPEAQKKALDELKKLVQEALNKHELTAPKPEPEKKKPDIVKEPAEEAEKKEVEVIEEKKEVEVTEEKKDVEVTEEKKEVEVTEEKKEVELTEEKKDVEVKEEKKEVEVTEEKKDVEVKEEKKEIEVTEEKKEVEVTEEKKEVEVKEEKKDVEVTEEKKEVEVREEKKEVEVTEEKKEVEVTEEKKEVEVTEEKKEEEVTEEKEVVVPEEVEIWGIPLLADERSDVILLKFLRARDFKVKDAFTMLKNTVRWRKEFGIDALVLEDFGTDWDKVVFTEGHDKQGHPVCYNVFGEFENKDLYNKTFSDEEKRNKFIRWRIQVLEKSVRSLDFSPTAISTIVQVNDLKNSPGLGKSNLRQATNQALQLLQDNYPEFVAKQIFINVPWWYLAFSRMISPFFTQRTKSKFVFAGPSKSAETLFKYIAPELVPIQYGGLSREGEQEFTTADPVTEVTIKPATKHAVEFPVSEKSHLVWEIRVVGWDVSYQAEFVPSAEDGYTVIVQKNRKIAPADESVISNGFKIGEAGKVVLTIDNQTSKKKKLLYRSKTKPIAE